MITIDNLSFRYEGGAKNALTGISMEIPDGDFLGIIGASGAGKSTLTYAMNGVVPHHFRGDYYGVCRVNGLDTVESKPEAVARHLGSVFQDIDSQMVASIVEDELLFGLENFGVDKRDIPARVEEALAAAGIAELRGRLISSLSGGQKQKVAIAAIVALRPRCIVLDEPTGELDPAASRKIFALLQELNEKHGITIIAVEQKIMLLCEFARRLAVMENGRVILDGDIRSVLRHGRQLEEAGVNIPRVTTLGYRLREAGRYAGELPVNVEEAVKMLGAAR
jgi:energy-coupling factor transport system ATP-binding protein